MNLKVLEKEKKLPRKAAIALQTKPSSPKKPARSTASATPREGVLVINGKNDRASAQGLKKPSRA
jgi:hypothetical protein